MLIKCNLDFLKIIEQDPVRSVELLGGPKRRFEPPFEVYALVEKQGLLYKLKNEFPVITMSPKTDMARRFHESNGAVLMQENKHTNNFAYPHLQEEA